MGNLKDRPIRFGIMGTGYVARQFAAGLRFVKDAQILAIGSRAHDTASDFSQKVCAPHAHGSYEALANDEDVDVIYVATPAGMHAENAILCLNAGKPVIIEKPFTINAAECEKVINIARDRSLFCMEAMWTRFIPAVKQAFANVRAGSIGEPHTLIVDFGIPESYQDNNHRFDRATGGAWLDRGVYGLSLAVQLFGNPVSITSNATTSPTGCDLQSSAILRFNDDRLAVVTASFSGYSSNEAVIAGSTGRIRLHETFVRADAISVKTAPARTTLPSPTSGRLKDKLKESAMLRRLLQRIRRNKTQFIPYAGNGFGHEAAEVVKCLQAGLLESPAMPLEDTAIAMQVCDQIRAKWLQGTPIT